MFNSSEDPVRVIDPLAQDADATSEVRVQVMEFAVQYAVTDIDLLVDDLGNPRSYPPAHRFRLEGGGYRQDIVSWDWWVSASTSLPQRVGVA